MKLTYEQKFDRAVSEAKRVMRKKPYGHIRKLGESHWRPGVLLSKQSLRILLAAVMKAKQ